MAGTLELLITTAPSWAPFSAPQHVIGGQPRRFRYTFEIGRNKALDHIKAESNQASDIITPPTWDMSTPPAPSVEFDFTPTALGPHKITITNVGSGTTDSFDIIVIPALSIASIAPDNGVEGGGTKVVLTGIGIQAGAQATIDGVVGVNTHVISDTTIEFETPPHAPGAVDVVVTNPDGQTTPPVVFTYTAAVTPPLPHIHTGGCRCPETVTALNLPDLMRGVAAVVQASHPAPAPAPAPTPAPTPPSTTSHLWWLIPLILGLITILGIVTWGVRQFQPSAAPVPVIISVPSTLVTTAAPVAAPPIPAASVPCTPATGGCGGPTGP